MKPRDIFGNFRQTVDLYIYIDIIGAERIQSVIIIKALPVVPHWKMVENGATNIARSTSSQIKQSQYF